MGLAVGLVKRCSQVVVQWQPVPHCSHHPETQELQRTVLQRAPAEVNVRHTALSQPCISQFSSIELSQVKLSGARDLRCYTALVHASGQGSLWAYACEILGALDENELDTGIFNAVLGAAGWQQAVALVERMSFVRCEANLWTYRALTSQAASAKQQLGEGRETCGDFNIFQWSSCNFL